MRERLKVVEWGEREGACGLRWALRGLIGIVHCRDLKKIIECLIRSGRHAVLVCEGVVIKI